MMRCDHVPINADLSASFDGKDIPVHPPPPAQHTMEHQSVSTLPSITLTVTCRDRAQLD